jgi:carboxypeptidase PM20D1
MKKFAIGVVTIIAVLIVIVLVKTIANSPNISDQKVSLEALPENAIEHMSQAIQIPTETPDDNYKYDSATFYKYRAFIDKTYPLVHSQLKRTIVDSFSYIYEWKGTDTNKLPIVLMAHYDVVPVEASAIPLWHAKPYGGEIKGDYIWGRGVLDDKSSMISLLEATEASLKAGFKPSQTIYLCFGGDEESNGRGAAAIVKVFTAQKKRFEMVVDEGGEISTEDNKDIKRPIASIGVGEKGYVTLVLTAKKEGGHSSIPGKRTAIDILSDGISTLRKTQMNAAIIPPIQAYLERIAPYSSSLLQKISLSNLWLFKPLVINTMSETNTSNAMIRTTIVPTVFNSGVRDNVIPTFATAMVNSRILPGETPQDVKSFVEKTIHDTNIKVTIYPNYETLPTTTTDLNHPSFKRVEKVIKSIVDSVIVTPTLMVGATDSRNYRTLSDGVVNFTPLTDAKGYHGIDERLLISDYKKCFNYYRLLIQTAK